MIQEITKEVVENTVTDFDGYLSDKELSECQDGLVEHPFKSFNGVMWSVKDVEMYNTYTIRLNQTKCNKTREYIKICRHKHFCLASGL